MSSSTPYLTLKSFLDKIFAFFLLILSFPILILISILVLFFLGRPIFFIQTRPGLSAKPFNIYKFRTMSCQADSFGRLLPDSFRLTPFGKFLRSTSLDELPSLFNILLGHMSFVGPRPLLVEYLPLYTESQALRHTLKPGLTGLAQVNGRNLSSWEVRLEYDTLYVQSVSLRLDLLILLKTIYVVFARSGISDTSSPTKQPFTGSRTHIQ